MLGIPSSGLHTNGYSLARKVLLEKYKLNEKNLDTRQKSGRRATYSSSIISKID